MRIVRRINAIAIAISAVVAIVAPAASARMNDEPSSAVQRQPAGSTSRVRPNSDQRLLVTSTTSTQAGKTAHRTHRPVPVVVRVSPPTGGFDWGDAAIGAAAATGVWLVVVAGALTLAGHRHSQPQHR
jgi:hypothetical protein